MHIVELVARQTPRRGPRIMSDHPHIALHARAFSDLSVVFGLVSLLVVIFLLPSFFVP
jgi:hypothetical protein